MDARRIVWPVPMAVYSSNIALSSCNDGVHIWMFKLTSNAVAMMPSQCHTLWANVIASEQLTGCHAAQLPETAKEVSDHLNEAARTVGEQVVPAADDVSANIMGHAKDFEKGLPAAADDVSGNVKATAKAAGEQAKIGADEVRPPC